MARILWKIQGIALTELTDCQRKFLCVISGCQASQREELTSGEVQGTFGKSGELPGNLWKQALKIHSERSSREVTKEVPGKFGEILESVWTFQKLGLA